MSEHRPFVWRYKYATGAEMKSGGEILNEWFDEGWEPFAATEDKYGSITIHLRRLEQGPKTDD
jgi:hypothetical protein